MVSAVYRGDEAKPSVQTCTCVHRTCNGYGVTGDRYGVGQSHPRCDPCYTLDPCVRFKKENRNYTITNTYTDNVFGALNDDEEAERRKKEIGGVWEIEDVGENEYFLGMRVQQDLELGMIRLTQHPY